MEPSTKYRYQIRLVLTREIILFSIIGILFFTIVSTNSAASSPRTIDITFYEHEHLKGQSYKVTLTSGDCVNLKQGRTFSSAKFSDLKACIAVFNADNCKQRRVIFRSGTVNGVSRFANVGANDDIASVRFCNESEQR